MEHNHKTNFYLFWGIITLIIILSFFILRPFLIAVASAFIVAYLLKPLNDALATKLPKPAAAITSILFALILILGITITILGSLISQISQIATPQLIQGITDSVKQIIDTPLVTEYLPTIISKIGQTLLSIISSSIKSIPHFILMLFVTLFTAYYILIDWDNLKQKITNFLPFKNRTSVVNQIEDATKNILIGTLLIALAETIVALIGFYFLGIKFAILLAFIVGIFAFIPGLGPLLVWLPLMIIEIINKDYYTAFGLLILGIILSTLIDGLLRIKVVGKRSKIHPLIMLLGILGGIQMFGLIGFILGPLILSILITIIENIPKKEFS